MFFKGSSKMIFKDNHKGEKDENEENNIKQNVLPIKTKIVAWWLIIIMGIATLLSSIFLYFAAFFHPLAILYYLFGGFSLTLYSLSSIILDIPFLGYFLGFLFIYPILFILLPLLFIFLGIFILRRKKLAWLMTIYVLPLLLLIIIGREILFPDSYGWSHLNFILDGIFVPYWSMLIAPPIILIILFMLLLLDLII